MASLGNNSFGEEAAKDFSKGAILTFPQSTKETSGRHQSGRPRLRASPVLIRSHSYVNYRLMVSGVLKIFGIANKQKTKLQCSPKSDKALIYIYSAINVSGKTLS